jgi:hypothetical protein
MIDTKELRIGNLLAPLGFDVSTCIVTGVSNDGIFVDGVPGMRLLDYSEVEPITITPEWLERLGFEKIEHRIEGTIYKKNWLRFTGYGAVTDWRGGAISSEHVIYIHQLQNLYHALTGEELTIKTN